MRILSRILVGLIGALSLLSVAQHWFRIDSLIAERGLSAIGAVGRANIRADIGGIFLGIGIFALMAAIRQSRTWLMAAIILTSAALLGRVVSLALDGASQRVLSPMIIEAVVITIMLAAYRLWQKAPEGL